MLGYNVPEPDEAMLISGKKGQEGAPFDVVVGHDGLGLVALHGTATAPAGLAFAAD